MARSDLLKFLCEPASHPSDQGGARSVLAPAPGGWPGRSMSVALSPRRINLMKQPSHDPASLAKERLSSLPIERYMAGRSFISGYPKEERLKISYFQREADGTLVGTAWFGPQAEGPPGHAHGGSISGVLDEAMGIAAWITGHPVVAAQLTVNFQRMVPLGTEATFEAWVERAEGRKLFTRSRLLAAETVLAEAQGLFIVLPESRLEELAQRAAQPQPQSRPASAEATE